MFSRLLGLAVLASAIFTIKTGMDTNPPYPHLVVIGVAMLIVGFLLLVSPRKRQ